MGFGNLGVTGLGAPALPDAPEDGHAYGREDRQWVRVVAVSGDTMAGPLLLAADPQVPMEAVTKQYVDTTSGLLDNLRGGSGIVLVREPGPPITLTIDSELYNWQQNVDANNNRLNRCSGIGVGLIAEAGVGVSVLGSEGFRVLAAAGEPFAMMRVSLDITRFGSLVAWQDTAPPGLANTVSVSTGGNLAVTLSPNNSEVLRATPNNRVGIMTMNPQFTLDVNGEVRTTTGYTFPDGTRQITAALPDAPLEPPEVYGRFQRAWVPVVPLAGGIMTGPLTLAANPATNLEAATKAYVDQLATGAIHYIGSINAATGNCVYTQESGFANGPLIPANAAPGGFVICTVAGTIPGGPANGITMEQGDWLISSGAWTLITIGRIPVNAASVSLAPPAFGASNVQAALNNADAEVAARVRLTGDTMTGLLTLSGNPATALQAVPRQYVDLRSMPAGGFTNQVLAKISGVDYATQWINVPLEAPNDNQTYGRRSLQWSRAVALAGDTMTGTLTGTSFVCNTDNQGFGTFQGGWFYKATGTGIMIRQSSGNQQPQIENNNGSGRRDILDANNGVTLTTAQTISGAKQFSTGINFGVATVTTPTDLTRHIRLWQGTGNSGFGFSITSGRLNYVVSATANLHVFMGDTTEFATITSAGVTVPGTENLIANRTADAQRPGVLWQHNAANRWQWRPTGDVSFALGLTRYNDAGVAQTPDVISFNRTSGLGFVAGDPTSALGIATKQYVDNRSSLVPWTAGQNYVVGQGVLYDNRVFRVVTAITNAPATPNFTTISPTGYGQTDYWSGDANITNWETGNWVLIATMPAYGTYRVEISDLHVANDTALMLDIVTGYNTATAVLAGQTHQGTGSWSEVRLSQASNGSAVLLQLKIGTRSGTPNFKIFITGEARGTTVNSTSIPKPLVATAGGADLGGTTRARIEDLLFASFATSGDIATSYGRTIRFSYLNTSDANDGKIGARLFNRGLNIVGVATEAGDNNRYIGLWGTVDMRQTASDFILARDPTAPMQAATKQYVDNRVGSGTGGASSASAAGCIDLSARFARVYSEGSDAGIGNNPPTLRTNSNGIHVSNANYHSPLFLPPVNYLGDGEPFFFFRESDFGLTINTDRTSMTAPVVVQYPNTAVFIRNGFANLWDYVGQVPTRLLQTPLKFNALANSYTLPANRGANNQWLASNGTGGTFWTGPLAAADPALLDRVARLEEQLARLIRAYTSGRETP